MFHVAGNKASETDFTTFQIGVGNILKEDKRESKTSLERVENGSRWFYFDIRRLFHNSRRILDKSRRIFIKR